MTLCLSKLPCANIMKTYAMSCMKKRQIYYIEIKKAEQLSIVKKNAFECVFVCVHAQWTMDSPARFTF